MRILLVTMQLGEGYVHGTERYVSSLGECLRARGHDVAYLAGDPRGSWEGAAPGDAGIGRLRDPARRIHHHPSHGWTAVEGCAPEPIAEWMSQAPPDVVHLAACAHVGVAAARAAREIGAALVVTAMDYWWLCPRGTLLRPGDRICDGTPGWRECLACVLADHPRAPMRAAAALAARGVPLGGLVLGAAVRRRGGAREEAARWRARRAILLGVLRDADALVFPSRATRDALAPQLGHDRWREIPYGLSQAWHEAGPAPRAARPGPRDPRDLVVGFAGSLQHHKGAHLLLEAAHLLGWTQTRIRIAGTRDEARHAARLEAAARGLTVEWAGALDSAGMRRFLRECDVLVVPSLWPENLPFVLLEAQAAGLPVIGSDVPGISPRIPDTDMLFRSGSAQDLARALAAFARASSHGAVPGVATLDEMTDATESLYRTALARQRALRATAGA